MKTLVSRVPKITMYFWIIKVLSTTVGETAADFLSDTMDMGLSVTSYIMGGLLLVAILIQFKLKRYVPASYWVVVVLMSIVGTLITDKLVDDMEVSLVTTTIVFSITLFLGFGAWYLSENTLSIETINTAKREAFYWAIILQAFALGTAGGDLFSEGIETGYALALLIFAAAIVVVAIGYVKFGMNKVFAFWVAYILTRPLGASLGDLLTQPTKASGLGVGTATTNSVFFLMIAGLVIYLTVKKNDVLVLEIPEDQGK